MVFLDELIPKSKDFILKKSSTEIDFVNYKFQDYTLSYDLMLIDVNYHFNEKKLVINEMYNSSFNERKIPYLIKQTLETMVENFEVEQIFIPLLTEKKTNLVLDNFNFENSNFVNLTNLKDYEKSSYFKSFEDFNFNFLKVDKHLCKNFNNSLYAISVFKNEVGEK